MTTQSITSFDPATGAPLWTGESGDVDHEVAIASAHWVTWASRSRSVRIETIRRYANGVRAKSEALSDLIARETGKPLWEARLEVDSLVDGVEMAIAAYGERTAQRRMEGAMGVRGAVRHKPHGVIAILTPFTMPAAIPSGHVVPALLAGNAVVLKPSEKTPATAALLVGCLLEAGVPDTVLRLVQGDAETGAALVTHPDVCGVLFTGSTAVGLALHRRFGAMPDRLLSLGMGGNNPIIAWDTPDIHAAATLVVQSAFQGAGQHCTAARRLIVRDGGHEALIEQIAKIVSRLIIGAPHDRPAPFMGPMIDDLAADNVTESYLALMMKGGRPITHLKRLAADRPFLSPALIDVTDVAQRPDAEIFGPLLQVIRVADFEAAIDEANATRHGLSATLLSDTPQLYDQFWANVRAGSLNWNRTTHATPPNTPFGGTGLSGNHRPAGSYLADHCAYPVVSSESQHLRAMIGIGLRDA